MRGRVADVARIYPPVLKALAKNPEGLTLRALCRQSGIPVSTVRYHLFRGLAGYVEDLSVGPQERPFARLIRLKPGAVTKSNAVLQRILGEVHD